ncbi:hypothetical protein DMN91_012763 [Ooceraea biroi]|uniref:Uncharacterized protein n=1 Tax=Ooceraea biroi TaxID=2015173 RepID=A0A3L8D3R4_OOCBI|nr:hypothetical protein DMN91_012763 [Ooceraea biroi]
MDSGCGQQPLFLGSTSGWGGISSPQQSAVQTSGTPSEHYGGPLSLSICISDSGHEILRPKPRRVHECLNVFVSLYR